MSELKTAADYIETIYGTRTFERALDCNDAMSIMDLIQDFSDYNLKQSHAPQMLDELKETIIDLKILRNQIEDANKTNHLFDGMADLIGKWIELKEQLIQQATTIK